MFRMPTKKHEEILGVSVLSYEMTIGLETHIELSTKTKIFCSCPVEFGKDANTNCCPVCTGMPGTLPVLNKDVLTYAIKAGLATNCKIRNRSQMARKNYVYPDLCKAYQISQFDLPLCYDGYITLSSGKKIRINRIHIEEDAGKLISDDKNILIDYNRGGTPLIEIVTEADFNSAEEVREYLKILKTIMKIINVSDCKMQEGSLRCDVNISIKEKGKLGTKCEIKNVNSFSFIAKAIEYEAKRQVNILKSGGKITSETLRYDSKKNITEPMRSKEEAEDYRYFPEPDLPDIIVTDEEIKKIKDALPELYEEKLERYKKDFLMSQKDAELLLSYPALSGFFDAMVLSCGGKNYAKICLSVMFSYVFKLFKTEEEKETADIPIDAKTLAEAVKLIADGEISNNFTKKIIETMFNEKKGFFELFKKEDFQNMREDELLIFVKQEISESEDIIKSYIAGNEKALLSVVGKIMKKTGGKADAKLAKELIIKEINQKEA